MKITQLSKIVKGIFFLLLFLHIGCSKSVTTNVETTINESINYVLTVDGSNINVLPCRVSAMPFNKQYEGMTRPLYQTEIASFASWDMKDAVTVEIISKKDVKSVIIRPLSLGIKPIIEGNKISFKVTKPGQIVIEVNDMHKALHLFANPPEKNIPSEESPNIKYFGPGIHEIGRTQLFSDDTVYIAPGAVVYGSFYALEASNIKIYGRGIIDVSKQKRFEGGGAISLSDCSNVTIEGVIMRDPDVWCVTLFGCNDITISNIKLIGLWRYNADGINVSNSQNITVQNSFIRSFDDGVTVKGISENFGKQQGYKRIKIAHKPIRNIIYKSNIIWCDWGKAIEVGVETVAPEISDVIFEDIDIIRTMGYAMDITNGDRAVIHNITFKNIRVEIDDRNPKPTIQTSLDQKYEGPYNFVPYLIRMVVNKNSYSKDTVRGSIKNILFKDIKVFGKHNPTSIFKGYSTEHQIYDVTIENLFIADKKITSLDEMKIEMGDYVENLTIK